MFWECFAKHLPIGDSMGRSWECFEDMFVTNKIGILWEWHWVYDGNHSGLHFASFGDAAGKASNLLRTLKCLTLNSNGISCA